MDAESRLSQLINNLTEEQMEALGKHFATNMSQKDMDIEEAQEDGLERAEEFALENEEVYDNQYDDDYQIRTYGPEDDWDYETKTRKANKWRTLEDSKE